jgi:hypothetical protein
MERELFFVFPSPSLIVHNKGSSSSTMLLLSKEIAPFAFTFFH